MRRRYLLPARHFSSNGNPGVCLFRGCLPYLRALLLVAATTHDRRIDYVVQVRKSLFQIRVSFRLDPILVGALLVLAAYFFDNLHTVVDDLSKHREAHAIEEAIVSVTDEQLSGAGVWTGHSERHASPGVGLSYRVVLDFRGWTLLPGGVD